MDSKWVGLDLKTSTIFAVLKYQNYKVSKQDQFQKFCWTWVEIWVGIFMQSSHESAINSTLRKKKKKR